MKPLTKGIIVALIHVLLVCSLGGKLLYDRHTRPQAWFKMQPYDPNLPVRGRYLSMRLELNDSRTPYEVNTKFAAELKGIEDERARYPDAQRWRWQRPFGQECGSIELRNAVPFAVFDGGSAWNCDNLDFGRLKQEERITLVLNDPVLFFIPDTADNPTQLQPGEELWVLATIPKKGLPRPISLGVKKSGETEIRPLDIR